MLNPWDLDSIADGDAQNFANVESLIWSHITDVLAAEQKQQPDDAKPSKWQQAMLDHANEVRQFAEQVTGKPQKDAMLTLQTKLGPMTYNNMKQAEAWLKAHTHNPVANIKDSKQVAKIVEDGQVKGEKYINLARRNMSDNALTQFDKIVSTASLDMRNGTTSQKALSKAAKQWADQGVPALIDKAGRHWSPDVYMRTVIESAVNQTTNDTELARYKQYGSLVRVSSHAGCRPAHLQFQDHIYSLTGDTEKYPDFESTTGYGTITGIGGINCRHHTLPYIEGEGYMKVPQMSDDDNATLYANKQTQRRLESNVRKAKRQQEAAEKLGDPADIANAKQLVTRRQTAVREFVNDKGLTRRYYREKIKLPDSYANNNVELLPRYNDAVIPVPKLRDYALNLEHPVGKNKAIVFKSSLGYTQDNYKDLIKQVKSALPHARAVKRGNHGHGMAYQVDMMIKGPNGKTKRVRTSWIDDKDSREMRLTSIYVKEDKYNDGKRKR